MAEVTDAMKARFPGERVSAACRATIIPVTEQTEEERARRSRVFVANTGTLVVTEKRLAFFVDRRNYYIMMAVIAFVAVTLAIMVLLGPIGMLTLATLILGAIVLALLEAFLYLQMKNASVFEFDRASTQIGTEPNSRKILVNGVKHSIGWVTEIDNYEITVTEGEEFPKL